MSLFIFFNFYKMFSKNKLINKIFLLAKNSESMTVDELKIAKKFLVKILQFVCKHYNALPFKAPEVSPLPKECVESVFKNV